MTATLPRHNPTVEFIGTEVEVTLDPGTNMSILLQLSNDLEARIRAAADEASMSVQDWLCEAARNKLRDDRVELEDLVATINTTPAYREALDRLADT